MCEITAFLLGVWNLGYLREGCLREQHPIKTWGSESPNGFSGTETSVSLLMRGQHKKSLHTDSSRPHLCPSPWDAAACPHHTTVINISHDYHYMLTHLQRRGRPWGTPDTACVLESSLNLNASRNKSATKFRKSQLLHIGT